MSIRTQPQPSAALKVEIVVKIQLKSTEVAIRLIQARNDDNSYKLKFSIHAAQMKKLSKGLLKG